MTARRRNLFILLLVAGFGLDEVLGALVAERGEDLAHDLLRVDLEDVAAAAREHDVVGLQRLPEA